MTHDQTAASSHLAPPAPRQREDGIRLETVSKTFAIGRHENVTALSNIDLTVDRGEFVALFGPSGCGKSTLLRLISGLDTPSSGTVLIEGTSPDLLISEHRLAFAFQEHALLPWATVAENIALPFRLARMRVDKVRVQQLIDMVGLSGFVNARPKQLSGGMRQRVAIARSLALNPDVLLLDEPFGALDEITRRKLNFELARIWAETGVTTVMVTHSVDEAVLLADRVIVMGTNPGHIFDDIEIALPRPRSTETFDLPEFHQLTTRLIQLLDAREPVHE